MDLSTTILNRFAHFERLIYFQWYCYVLGLIITIVIHFAQQLPYYVITVALICNSGPNL